MRFKTQYSSTPFKGEKNNGEFMIDPTGYIPPKRQIENMLYAGALLDQSRLSDYDFREGDELEYRKEFDVRKPDFDVIDADRIMSGLGQSEAAPDAAPEAAPDAAPEAAPANSES